jgi:uncharacterized OB-fold protein
MNEMLEKPLPRISPDTKPFWDGCADHRLLLPTCVDCNKPHLPPGPVCPFCFSDQLEYRPSKGFGHISTFTVVHKAWFPSFTADIPYNVVQVELDEGPRLSSALINASADMISIGDRVSVVFIERGRMTLPYFEKC